MWSKSFINKNFHQTKCPDKFDEIFDEQKFGAIYGIDLHH